MKKYEYRSYFAECKKYVKLTPLCHECNVSQSALSRFMMGEAYDYVISEDSLKRLYDHMHKVLEKIV